MSEVRLAVVGLGGWGKNVVRSFGSAKNSRLSYVCDRSPDSLAAHQRLFPQATATDSYERILMDENVDAVVLATPAPLHFRMAHAALMSGKHVYVEKPMTLTTQDAEELVRTADRVGRKLMVGHLLEYHPAVEYIREQIQSEALGQVYYMYCQRLNLGVVRQEENAFWSLAPHDISVILYLFGQEPDRVTASGECYLQRGIEDVVFANLHFPDGRTAQIHVSWLDPHKARKMVVVGSKRMLAFDDMEASEKIRVYDKRADVPATVGAAQAITVRHGDIHIPHLPTREPLQIEAQHFVDCIREDRTPRSDGRDGLRVVRILEKVDRCLKEARGEQEARAAA